MTDASTPAPGTAALGKKIQQELFEVSADVARLGEIRSDSDTGRVLLDDVGRADTGVLDEAASNLCEVLGLNDAGKQQAITESLSQESGWELPSRQAFDEVLSHVNEIVPAGLAEAKIGLEPPKGMQLRAFADLPESVVVVIDDQD